MDARRRMQTPEAEGEEEVEEEEEQPLAWNLLLEIDAFIFRPFGFAMQRKLNGDA